MSRLSERIENFNRAFVLYEQAHTAYCADKENKLIQMALVQGFEIVFELGWKCLKDYLASKNIEEYTPKDVIKAAVCAALNMPHSSVSKIYIKSGSATQISYFEKWSSLMYCGYIPM